MNTPTCTATLAGWIEGDTWSRWRVAGEGQVRFWLRSAREGAGSLLCALPVRSGRDLREAHERLVPGRRVEIVAVPSALWSSPTRQTDEQGAGVVFLVSEMKFDEQDGAGEVQESAPSIEEHVGGARAGRICGKMAAAGEHKEDAT